MRGIDVDSEGRLFILADDSKMYRSEDRGETWTEVLNIGVEIYNIYVDSNDQIYVKYGAQMRRSNDHGETWNAMAGWVDAGALWHWDESSNGTIYVNNYAVAEHDYIYRSVDNGSNWEVWYNVSASSNPVRHLHGVKVAPDDQVIVMTGDADITEDDDDTIRRYNGSAWETIAESNSSYKYETRWIDCFFMDGYCYGCPDYSNYIYRFNYTESNSTAWNNRDRIQRTEGMPDNEFYDAVTIDGVGTFITSDTGDLHATWDGLHYVKVYEESVGIDQMALTNRDSFPLYFEGNGKLCRLEGVTREDLIHLFYKVYNEDKGLVVNAETYILEQRIHAGTQQLDLTTTMLTDVSASIKGLTKQNIAPDGNAGFEWGNESGWEYTYYGGEWNATNIEQYEGSYSLEIEKEVADPGISSLKLPEADRPTIKPGDIIIVSFAIKSNVSAVSDFMYLQLWNVTGSSEYVKIDYDSTTEWRVIEYIRCPNSGSEWELGVSWNFDDLDITSYIDAVLIRIPETAYQRKHDQYDTIGYMPELFNTTYFLDDELTTNPSITGLGTTVSHVGTLTNGTESSTTSLSGTLTGAVDITVGIQGSEQCILKLNGTRVFNEDSTVIEGVSNTVYYGSYYDSFSPTTTMNDLVAVSTVSGQITDLTYEREKSLTIVVTHPSGSAVTLQVYCGREGEPTYVTGELSSSYNATSNIETIIAQSTVQVLWTLIPPSVRTPLINYMYMSITLVGLIPLLMGVSLMLIAWREGGEVDPKAILGVVGAFFFIAIALVVIVTILGAF